MKTLVIAEIGHNHNGNMNIAKKLIGYAKRFGASIAKFQVYDTDSLGIKETYGQEVYDDLKTGELTQGQLNILKQECDNVGIEFFCSVFDTERLGWTEDLEMNRYKIASRSIYDTKLVDAVINTGKPIIVSNGMIDERGIPDNLKQCTNKVDVMYCVSQYPTAYKDIHFPDFKNENIVETGFSDHTIGYQAPLVAVTLGANIIEKHFTLHNNMPGYDQQVSMEPLELNEMVKRIKIIEEIIY